MSVKNATTGAQGAPFKQIQRNKELLLYAYDETEPRSKPQNVVISRCCFEEDDTIILKCVPHAYFLPFDQLNS